MRILLVLPMLLVSVLLVNNAYAQIPNINQIMDMQYPNTLGCGLVKINSARAYIPYQIKIYKDPIAQINVTSDATIGSQINTDGTQPNAYIVWTNSTDDNIKIHASIDYKSLPLANATQVQRFVHIEYWSAGELMNVEKELIPANKWCKDFWVSTSIKPTPPDIPALIQQATKTLFDKTLAIVDENTRTTGTGIFLNTSVSVLLLVLFGLQGLNKFRGRKKKKKSEEDFDKAVKDSRLSLANQQIAMKEVERQINRRFDIMSKEVSIRLNSAMDLFENSVNTIKIDFERILANSKPIIIEPAIKENKNDEHPEKEIEIIEKPVTEKKTEYKEIDLSGGIDSLENPKVFDNFKKISGRVTSVFKKEEKPLTDHDFAVWQYMNEYSKIKKDGKLDVERLQKMYNEWSEKYEKEPSDEINLRMTAIFKLLYGDKQ